MRKNTVQSGCVQISIDLVISRQKKIPFLENEVVQKWKLSKKIRGHHNRKLKRGFVIKNLLSVGGAPMCFKSVVTLCSLGRIRKLLNPLCLRRCTVVACFALTGRNMKTIGK